MLPALSPAIRLALAVLLVLPLLTFGGVVSLQPSPAQAHKRSCQGKHGKARRRCVKSARRHRRSHVSAAARRCTKRRPCQAVTPTATATPAPIATATPIPTRPPAQVTEWRSVGSLPLPDATAASRVRPAAESRPDNAGENAYRPSAAELEYFRTGEKDKYGRTAVQYNRLAGYVTGGFSGSTDEILQWAAHKWGIPEDVVRAVAVNESYWRMSQLGDRRTVSSAGLYPLLSRIAGTSDVYESLGITQIKWRPGSLHVGTEPLRWRSTAFNVDYWAANIRYYYDGLCSWCGAGYSAGQAWASVGAWYNPSPWNTSTTYVDHVKAHMVKRTWAGTGF